MAKRKDTSVIPKGEYCYSYDEDGTYRPCPYHGNVEGEHEQYDGYCAYLDKNDRQLAGEMIMEDCKTGEKTLGSDLPFPVSLLWDQVKECNINMDRKNDQEDGKES